MNAIVTGGKGFIGSHLVDLLARDQHVLVIDDGRSGANEPPPCVEVANVSVQAAYYQPCDVIYHLAGPVGPVGVLSRAGTIARDVIADASTVARAAVQNRATLVYVSTSELYGPQPVGETGEEANRIIPAGHTARMEYAVAKLAAETMLLNTPGLDVRIVRPFNVAGPRQREEGGFVLPRFIRQAKNDEPLTVYQPGSQVRAFTHVADIVQGIYLAATEGKAGEVYNLGNPKNKCTIRQLAAEVVELLSSDSEIHTIDPKTLWGEGFAEAPDKVPNPLKAMFDLGWEPLHDRAAIIADAAR